MKTLSIMAGLVAFSLPTILGAGASHAASTPTSSSPARSIAAVEPTSTAHSYGYYTHECADMWPGPDASLYVRNTCSYPVRMNLDTVWHVDYCGTYGPYETKHYRIPVWVRDINYC